METGLHDLAASYLVRHEGAEGRGADHVGEAADGHDQHLVEEGPQVQPRDAVLLEALR